MSAPLVPEVVEQHAVEASFLWSQRSRAIREPQYDLAGLMRLDERVEAHLDGLRIAGARAWEIYEKVQPLETAGDAFARSSAALASGSPELLAQTIAGCAAVPDAARGFVSALGWVSWDRAEAPARKLLEAESPAERRMAVAAWAIHRRDPGQALLKAAEDSDTGLRARAFRAVGELGLSRLALQPGKIGGLPDPECRYSAAWSAALLGGRPEAASALADLAESGPIRREAAVRLAARRLGLGLAGPWLRKLPGRLAVIGIGAAGDPDAVATLLEGMRAPELARIAGEAFSMITGADLEDERLAGGKPEGFEAGPNDDPADPNVEMDPDENLPWPDVPAIAAWWKGRAAALKPGTRHLLGKPIEAAWLRKVLRDGKQRQRAAAALELAMLEPGKPLFEVRAPGFRQKLALT